MYYFCLIQIENTLEMVFNEKYLVYVHIFNFPMFSNGIENFIALETFKKVIFSSLGNVMPGMGMIF